MIRPALLSDTEVMAEMHRLAFPPQEAWNGPAFAQLLGLPGCFGLIGEAGFLLARAIGGEAEVLTLAVLEQRRRQGIGRALLEAAMHEAAGRGAEALFLEVAGTNRAACALYAALGAEAVGRRPAYYPGGGDAILLRITLPRPCVSAAT